MTDTDPVLMEGDGSVANLLWQFDRELAQGLSPDWPDYLSRCTTGEEQIELCRQMIRCEQGHRAWDPDLVRMRLWFYASFDLPASDLLRLVQDLYMDRLEQGDQPTLRDFESLGYSADDLQLCGPGDVFYLGHRVGKRYRVDARLGRGGFGLVYLGFDETDSRPVVIKTTPLDGDLEWIRFAESLLFQEISATLTLAHPAIPKIVDMVTERPMCLVREFIDGQTLAEIIKQDSLDPEHAAELVAVLADVVEVAHQRGLIFRDLSPRNVLVGHDGAPRLIDPALAVSFEGQQRQRGELAGTRGYMSPESQRGETSFIDRRADVWAIGALFFELLTGKPGAACGLRADSDGGCLKPGCADLERGVWLADHPQVREVPSELRRICSKCLESDLLSRYQTAHDIACDLRRFLGREMSETDHEHELLTKRCLPAWRLGVTLDRTCRQLRRFRLIGKPPSRFDREHILAAYEAYKDTTKIGLTIGLQIPLPEGIDELRDLHWPLNDGDASRFKKCEDAFGESIEKARELIRFHLRKCGNDAIELFEFAQSLRTIDDRRAGALHGETVAGIPAKCTDHFFRTILDKEVEGLEVAIDILNKNVEHWILARPSGPQSTENDPADYRSEILSLIARYDRRMNVDWGRMLSPKTEELRSLSEKWMIALKDIDRERPV